MIAKKENFAKGMTQLPTGQKYQKLSVYLQGRRESSISLSFSDIEHILGFNLGKAAHSYPAFWSNTLSQPLANAWLKAGYRSENLSLQAQRVTFARADYVSPSNREKTNTLPQNTLPVNEAVQYILIYFKETENDSHGRYLSWEHCYKAFCNNRRKRDEATVDYLSQLGNVSRLFVSAAKGL